MTILFKFLAWLGTFLGGPFAQTAMEAFKAKLDSENSKDRIAADLAAKQAEIDVQRQALENQLLIAEQGRWWRAVPQFIVELTVALYIAKLGADKILGVGFTATPGDTFGAVMQIALVGMFGSATVLGAAGKLARLGLRK